MENKKDTTRGDKYLFERSKKHRFNQINKDKKFLAEQKDLLEYQKTLYVNRYPALGCKRIQRNKYRKRNCFVTNSTRQC